MPTNAAAGPQRNAAEVRGHMSEQDSSETTLDLQSVRVLLVTDRYKDTALIESQLHDAGVTQVLHIRTGQEGILAFPPEATDIVILDASLSQPNALILLMTLGKTHPEVPVIFATHQKDMCTAQSAHLHGAVRFLTSEEISTSSLGTTISTLARKIFRRREADLLHSDMAFMMSHDLLIPLSNILGYAQTLMQDNSDNLNNDQKQAISGIVSNSVYMNSIMQSILTGIKIEAGRVTVRPQLEDLPVLINASLERNKYLTDRKGITLTRSFCLEHLCVSVDPTNLSQIMNNLVANAAKFTPRDSTITVGFDLLPGRVRVYVADQGGGLSNLDQGSLFKEFPRVAMSVPNHGEGNGLGLFIVAHLVRLNRGEVGVDCPESGGTVFWFTLPLESQDQVDSGQAGDAREQLPGKLTEPRACSSW
jgi:signal transduction histidine kinase